MRMQCTYFEKDFIVYERRVQNFSEINSFHSNFKVFGNIQEILQVSFCFDVNRNFIASIYMQGKPFEDKQTSLKDILLQN